MEWNTFLYSSILICQHFVIKYYDFFIKQNEVLAILIIHIYVHRYLCVRQLDQAPVCVDLIHQIWKNNFSVSSSDYIEVKCYCYVMTPAQQNKTSRHYVNLLWNCWICILKCMWFWWSVCISIYLCMIQWISAISSHFNIK